MWRALSDPTRRRILEILRRGELSAGEIASEFDTTWPTISHHLDKLKEAGLITARREGKKILYSLNLTLMEEVMAYIAEFFDRGGEKDEKE